MNQHIAAPGKSAARKTVIILVVFVVIFVTVTMLQDLAEARFRKSAFYFSESFLFSSFWWLFAPFLFSQYYFIEAHKAKTRFAKILIIVLPALMHLFAYPGLVWLASKLFYYHTFRYRQTLNYSLSEHLYSLIFFYSVPVLLYSRYKKNGEVITAVLPKTVPATPAHILVQEGTKRITVAVADVLYFTASSPYISIHLFHRKYLHNETLKSLMEKLPCPELVRIHKSTIINIKQVVSYSSRQNGDYDVMMQNNTVLRVSRNYAAEFKAALLRSHQLTAK